jgi:hypothetical protein
MDGERVSWSEAMQIARDTADEQERRRQALAEREADEADVYVWRAASREAWETYRDKALAAAGITYDELARRAREQDFEGGHDRALWIVFGE